ncbi:MAG TPA: ATP synthase F1 subunit gamma [Anaerolineales bacterium]|nr:ATP synthase F1 subunit gamma [Anaerolineales bacterium]
MASVREMRLRIRSVKNIAQVTRALEAVSASKVRKAQQAVLATRAYANKAKEILADLSNQPGSVALLHPLLNARPEVKAIDIILITGDRGLAGAYNANIVREAFLFSREQSVPVRWVTVGRKGRDLTFRRRGNIVAEFTNLSAAPTALEIAPIARTAIDDFLSGAVDEVYIAYTDFVNTLKLIPTVRKILPFTAESVGAESSMASKLPFIYEPSAGELLNVIVPRFAQLQVLQAVLESLASEHSARMVAMRNATDNAQDLIGTLTLDMNKARQLAITSDLLDIAGGAEAMAKAAQQK